MEIKRGIPVSPGVAIRQAFVLGNEDVRISRRHFVETNPEHEEIGRASCRERVSTIV